MGLQNGRAPMDKWPFKAANGHAIFIGRQGKGDRDRSRVHTGYGLGNQSEGPGYLLVRECEQLDYMWVIRLLELATKHAGVEHKFDHESVSIDCVFRFILEDDSHLLSI